jgi:hypothetical protein
MADTVLVELIDSRKRQGYMGVQIAEEMLSQSVEINAAKNAFLEMGYVAEIHPFHSDVNQLHVSNTILEGIALAIAYIDTRTLPSVIWRLPESGGEPTDNAETE